MPLLVARWAFVVAVAALAVVPFIGMAWAPTTQTTENRDLAPVPSLLADGSLNESYLSDWGTYFEDHFAYRNQLVSANSRLRALALGVSSTDSVVVGADGWLYYGGTLSDYCGWASLSDRALDNIAFNLSLMQGYCNAQGASFAVAIAPNKNTLYPDHMPYYYVSSDERNLPRLQEALERYGVASADLQAAFQNQSETLYYLRDSHWNTKGALLACDEITALLDRQPASALLAEPDTVDGYIGDLNSMLYPTGQVPEQDYSYDLPGWAYLEGNGVTESWVATEGSGSGSLLAFRDSFANNMIPFLASSYQSAYFSKLVPYDLTQVDSLGVSDVVIERAERHLSDLGEDPAIMPAPAVDLDVSHMARAADMQEGITVREDGSFSVLEGCLPQECRQEGCDIFVGIQADGEEQWFVPFRVSTDEGDYGYKAFVAQGVLEKAQKISVACAANGTLMRVQEIELK